MTSNAQKYKEVLEKEYADLIEELKTVGRVNPDNPFDWEPIVPEHDESEADPNVAADTYEEYEANTAILKQLEIRFNKVGGALERMKNGNFGKCEVCGKDIEEKRLEADPATTLCIQHMEK